MRRLPIYFLIDVSESMVGEPIKQVEEGMRMIIQELRTDPYALETVHIGIIAFAGKTKVLTPLTELYKFYPPTFPIGGGTSLGNALQTLMKEIETSVTKTTLEQKGDWKPIVFLFTDGTPTDNPISVIDKWNAEYRRRCNIVAISIGDNADIDVLNNISENVLNLKSTDETSFKTFFKWVTASIKTTSASVTNTGIDEVNLAPIDGIKLEKVDTAPLYTKIDENFAVIPAKCQETNKMYLIKYAKRGQISPELESIKDMLEYKETFKLVGAYPINEEEYKSLSDGMSTHRSISTSDLIGRPTCPCCGNQYGMVICDCGNVFCVGEDGVSECPWCGMEGELTFSDNSMDIRRGRG